MLVDAMKHQFGHAFDMLADGIGSFPAERWRCPVPGDKAPGRLALHVLACAEFYTCHDRSVHRRFGKHWGEMVDEELPSQEQLLQYLADVRSKTACWIDSIGDAGLDLAHEGPLPAINNLERIAYALRHLAHHVGELCAYQKQCGLHATRWR